MKKALSSLLFGLLTLTLCLCMSGCYDYSDIEDSALVAGIAIDTATEGFEVTVELLSMNSDSGEASPKPLIISVNDKTVAGALEKMVEQSARKLYFGHCVAVLISEAAAKNGIRDYVDFFFHDARINVSLDMLVVKGAKASEVFECKAVNGNLVSFDIAKALKETASGMSSSKSIKIYEFITALENPGREPFLPAVKVVESSGEKRFGVDGTAVFIKDKLQGFFTSDESMYFMLLNGEFSSGTFSVTAEDGSDAQVEITDSKVSITHDKKDISRMYIGVDVKLSLKRIPEYLKLNEKTEVGRFEQKVNEQLESALYSCIRKMRDEFGSDVLAYGYHMYRAYPAEYRKLASADTGYLEKLSFSIKVNSKIGDSGLSDIAANEREAVK